MQIRLYLILISLALCSSCKHSWIRTGDFNAIYQEAQNGHKYIWMILGGGEHCASCNQAINQLEKSGITHQFQNDYIFYKSNVNDSLNRFLHYIFLMEAVPNSYILNPQGEIIYFHFGSQSSEELLNILKSALKKDQIPLPLHHQFQSQYSQLLKMQNLLLQAALIYHEHPQDSIYLNKALKLTDQSIAIEPFFYNLYLKSQILNDLHQTHPADSCILKALSMCPPGYQTLVFASLLDELKSKNKYIQPNQDSMPQIKFAEQNIQCGEIPYNTHHKIILPFKNSGKTPLIITFVSSTCSCATPQWDTQPIFPGESGEIKVDYQATGKGTFNRTIFIQSNSSNGVTKVVLKGVVK